MKRRRNQKPVVLTIAGSDSGGGAGIQADLKVFAALGTFGASAITALTAQNTKGVRFVQHATQKSLREQIAAVREDLAIAAVKTGMIPTPGHVRALSAALADIEVPVVVDPVLVATTGAKLADSDTLAAMTRLLFPLASVITPNLAEAEAMLGAPIPDADAQAAAARALAAETGARVVITGGDRRGRRATDVLASPDGETHVLRARRLPGEKAHGSGCMFASAIAAGLANGRDTVDAVYRAKRFVTVALTHPVRPGKGHGSPDPFGGTE